MFFALTLFQRSFIFSHIDVFEEPAAPLYKAQSYDVCHIPLVYRLRTLNGENYKE